MDFPNRLRTDLIFLSIAGGDQLQDAKDNVKIAPELVKLGVEVYSSGNLFIHRHLLMSKDRQQSRAWRAKNNRQ